MDIARQGNHGEALQICNNIISEFPDYYEGYEKRSYIFHQMGDHENAFKDIEEVIRIVPGEPAPFFKRGRWKLNLGLYNEAIDNFTKVIDFGSDYFIDAAYFFRAIANFYIKKYEKALSDCDNVPDKYHLGPKYMTKAELVHRTKKAMDF